MAFTVSNFKSGLAGGGGGARPALYEVTINNTHDPDLGFGVSASKVDGLLVKAASIPAANIAPLAVNYAGRAYKWSGFRTYDNWTVTVLNDEDFAIRNKMMEWMRVISGKLDGTRNDTYGSPLTGSGAAVGYFDGNATVKQLGTDGETKQVYKFYNLWPTELAEIAVDWSSDAIQEYTVAFAYDYWSHGEATAPATATVAPILFT